VSASQLSLRLLLSLRSLNACDLYSFCTLPCSTLDPHTQYIYYSLQPDYGLRVTFTCLDPEDMEAEMKC
jgi:hypothetical protein